MRQPRFIVILLFLCPLPMASAQLSNLDAAHRYCPPSASWDVDTLDAIRDHTPDTPYVACLKAQLESVRHAQFELQIQSGDDTALIQKISGRVEERSFIRNMGAAIAEGFGDVFSGEETKKNLIRNPTQAVTAQGKLSALFLRVVIRDKCIRHLDSLESRLETEIKKTAHDRRNAITLQEQLYESVDPILEKPTLKNFKEDLALLGIPDLKNCAKEAAALK